MSALISTEDFRMLTELLPSREVAELQLWCEVCLSFNAASREERGVVASALAERYSGRISGGLSVKTLYRKAALFRAQGWRGLVPARYLRKAEGRGGVGNNGVFVAFWQKLLTDNKRAIRPAFSALIALLRSGEKIPGYGTWRDIWRSERPGEAVPAACPYGGVGRLYPLGWSLVNLRRFQPSAFGMQALRVGTLSAANLLPGVPRTRAGLKRGQIIEIDDMWHDVKCMYGRAKAERCIELATLDVATGYRTYLLKPIRRRDDGSREMVMGRMMPYLLGYWLICQGYCAAGAIVCGEHNTAAASKALRAAVEAATGGKVRFEAGGLLSKPLAKGLWDGRPRGNFRFKARLEGNHSLVHNELGAVDGQVGYTRETAPEDLYSRDKAEGAMERAAMKLSAADPGLWERLRWPYIPYSDYSALVAEAVERINNRTEHTLEGWEEQGFMTGMWRLGPREPWQDMAALDSLGDGMRRAVMAQLRADPTLTQMRRLSPSEAWERRSGDVVRADRCFMPQILGEELAVGAVCTPKLELRVKDAAIDLDATVVGLVTAMSGTEFLLRRGERYLVWIHPMEPTVAYIGAPEAAGGWRYLGTAPVATACTQNDKEGILESLKLRSKVQALERAAIAGPVALRAAEKAEADAQNAAAFAAAEALAAGAVAKAGQARCQAGAKVLQGAGMDDLI